MQDAILVINAGSSSIKFSAFAVQAHQPPLQRVLGGKIESLGTSERPGPVDNPGASPHFVVTDGNGQVLAEKSWRTSEALSHDDAMAFLLEELPPRLEKCQVRAVGHRVVHGGAAFSSPARVNDEVLHELEKLIPLAPLHQPHNLAAIRTLKIQMPDLPQVACFDTAFHHTLPEVARAFALPQAISARGVRRYGFHGLSYEYIASVMAQFDPALSGRVVVLHLGNGASMCAMRDGRSIATTMGFTALDGLPMGTRCGSLDPGVVLYLLSELGMDADQVLTMLYEQSGLLGMSGVSGDMRALEASDDPAAQRAIELYVYRISQQLGALAATLGGLDAIVFTAGIGEHSVHIRSQVCCAAAWLGVELDTAANQAHASRISTIESRVGVWVIPTDEEQVIARHTWADCTSTSD
ncbi:MAG: acetate/propionate family kinase [Gammaproteobacteria bacterium]